MQVYAVKRSDCNSAWILPSAVGFGAPTDRYFPRKKLELISTYDGMCFNDNMTKSKHQAP